MDRPLLSDEQREAAERLDRNVLLFAGAGCGKTATLVERYVNILREGRADVSGIVAITFTEKAANELKGRVRGRLAELAKGAADEPEREMWRGHLLAMESAEIGTIHSFCMRILREFPVEAGVDPEFELLDDVEAQRLMESAVRDAVFEGVTAGDGEATGLLESFELPALSEMLLGALSEREAVNVFRASAGDAYGDCAKMGDALREKAETLVQAALIESLTSPEFEAHVSVLRGAEGPAEDAVEEKRAAFLAELASWRAVGGDTAIALARMEKAVGELRGGSPKAWGKDLARVKEALKGVRDIVAKARELVDVVTLEDWSARARDMVEFISLHDAVAAAYAQAKRRESALDFDDLLIRARDLIRDRKGIAQTLAKRCRFILVDEFQDTDHVQEELISALAENGSNLFVVGDPEQSIYSFRGAEVEVFSKVREDYAASQKGVSMSLTGNYRSRAHIVSFVNALFAGAMPAGSGQPEWRTSHQPLAAKRSAEGTKVEIILAESTRRLHEARRIEAAAIARRVGEILSTGTPRVAEKVNGSEVERPARAGDIAILLRSMSDVGIYERALQDAGIGYYTVAGSTFYVRQEVKDIINFLRFVVDGDDTLSLAGALRSPLFAVSDDYLTALALKHPLGEYFDGAEASPGGADEKSFMAAVSLVASLRAAKNRLSARELVERVLDATGYPAAVSMLFGGAQRAANVLALRDAAAAFDARGSGSTEDFVAHLSELELAEAGQREALVEAEDANTVRIMTIHSAKGLEFPIVILADTGRARNSSRHKARIDRELGICFAESDDEPRPYRRLINWVDDDRSEAEEKRIFYVAATRGRDHFILSGAMCKAPKGWMGEAMSRLGINPGGSGGRDCDGFTIEYSQLSELPSTKASSSGALLEMRDALLSGETPAGAMPKGAEEALTRAAPIAAGRADYRRFTATQIETFCQCPLRYELTHLRGLPPDYILNDEPPLSRMPGNVVGTRLHAALEAVRPGESLVDALERVLEPERTYGASPERLRAECRSVLERVEESDFYRRITKAGGEREQAFSFLLDGRMIEGKIDRCIDAEIVDFKSDDIPASETRAYAERYRAQMDVYALAFAKLKGKAPRKVTVFFLRPLVAVEWEYGENGLRDAAGHVKKLIESIEAGPAYAPEALRECRCDHASVCALLGGLRSTSRQDPQA